MLFRSPELHLVKRDSLFEDKFPRGTSAYDLFPDGKRFLMTTAQEGALEPTLILNWPALLERRGTANR